MEELVVMEVLISVQALLAERLSADSEVAVPEGTQVAEREVITVEMEQITLP